MRKPQVSTVTLSWNQKKDLSEVLKCVKKQTTKPTETIVVDNGSSDGTTEMIKKHFPWVKFFPLKENTGYAKGYNICFSKVAKDADYVIVLDQDVIVPDNYIETIVKRFEKEPDETAILMCDLEEPKIKSFAMQEGYVKVFHGSCWSYRNKYRNLIKFEEKFFAYSNEADLSARLLNKELRILFYPGCKVFHKHDSTQRSSSRLFLETRNWLWTIWRNYPVLDGIVASFFATLHMGVKSVRNKKLRPFVKGLLAAIAGFPYCIKTREVCNQFSWKDVDEVRYLRTVLGGSK